MTGFTVIDLGLFHLSLPGERGNAIFFIFLLVVGVKPYFFMLGGFFFFYWWGSEISGVPPPRYI